jgi:PAS domain S-box-containing protein
MTRKQKVSLEETVAELFRKSEQRISFILAGITDCHYELDRDWCFIRINDQSLAYFGRKREELIGQSYWEVFPTLKDSIFKEQFNEAVSKSTSVHFDVTSILYPGKWIEFHAYPTEERGISVFFRDVTEHKRATEETKKLATVIQEERDRLSALVNSIQDEVWFADTDHRFTLANPSALRAFRLDASAGEIDVEEFVQSLEVYRPDGSYRPVDEAPPLRALKGEVVRNQEEAIRTPAGAELRYREVSAAPVRDATNNIIGSVSVVRDITERKRMEQKLRQSERLYRAIGESIDYGVWVCAPDGQNIYASESFLKMVGLTQEECSNFGWGNVLHPDDAERTIAAWQECVRTEGTWNIEHRFRGADGQWHHVLARGIPVRDERGQIACWAGINLDIGDLKEAREALRKANEELELRVQERTAELSRQAALLDLAHDAIIVRDMEGKIFFWSSGAEATYGFTKEEAVGKITHTLLQSKFPIPLTEIVEIANRLGRWEGELTHTCKKGKQISVLSRWTVRKGAVDGTVEILEINQDITKRKQAEDLLVTFSAYNRSLIEASLDPLMTIDPGGRITDVNTATERVTGYSRDSLIETDFSDYFTDSEKAQAGYRQVFKEGFVRDYELEIRHKDGHLTPVLYNASVYKNEAGNVIGVFAAARDITEQRRLEEQLRQAHKMEAIGTLAGGIAHDFNNILAAIIGFSEMVEEDLPPESPSVPRLQRVLNAASRGRDLVRQILAFSRKTEPTRKPLSLSPVIKETVQLLRASLPTTIEIRLSLKAARDTALASPAELQQILMNLTTNASFSMKEKGGILGISVTNIDFEPDSPVLDTDVEPGEYVQIVVQDSGSGMRPDIVQRIFEPFFTTKGVGEGTGMGLPVVYGVVKSLNGTIAVESEPGVGSTFRVFIPVTRTDEKPKGSMAQVTPKGTEHILFVDDEEFLTEWGQAALERLGYTVTALTDSTQALNLFSSDPIRFDLVIVDQTMPKLTGLHLARKLLTIRNDIPIILCTGHSDSVSPEKAKEAGIREFLMKPLGKQQLAEVIRRILNTTESEG